MNLRKLKCSIKTNSKCFYGYINRKQAAKINVGSLLNETDELITANKEMVDMLNKFYASVFTVEDIATIPQVSDRLISINMVELTKIPITRDRVFEKLKGLKAAKLPRPDELQQEF